MTRTAPSCALHRYHVALLVKALRGWAEYLSARQRKAGLVAAAQLQYGHRVMARWHMAAAACAAAKRGATALHER